MQKKTKESPKQQDDLSLKNKHLTIHKELYRQRTCFNARFFLYLCRIFTRTIVIMTKANKVLFITQEITPYVSESEMANIGRHLPQAIQEKGREIRTFMPKWGNINERRNQLHEVIRLSGMNLIIDDTDHPLIIKVASIQSARMQVYFIDNDDYFQNRLQTADENGVEYDDNDSRAIFYARGVLETVKKLRWCPDVIHCHGWMTALAPLYIKKAYKDEPSFRDAKVVFSVYEDDFKGTFNSLVAGFLETGETLEECVAREGKEETGLDVKNITYFANQPWPYPSGLMVGFIADYAGGELTLQDEELSSGAFYTRDNLPELPRKLSLARKMIDWWIENGK